ncbi:MAG: exsH 1 [Devosia sp.]|uniref:M10 family metallopeptidase C-terminal domain-containing protein n=1 Tax=Devosia sp. TaxID=1871048 RepID=UPI0026043F58|nr:M10 family metallopeptidase C-terminal domain-containing protein [Devosia sp.]MDB5541663.1 exsH 1 [Devosia sp.]
MQIEGTPASETLIGSELDDIIAGRGGDDHILGLGGPDFLFGGAGADILEGGEGNDYYGLYDDMSDTIIDTGGEDRIMTWNAFSLVDHPDIEGLVQQKPYGGRPLTGNDGYNDLTDSAGGNLLKGLGGFDRLDGGGGDDFINGGTGQDYLTGGQGRDRFDFASKEDSGVGAANRDYLYDFKLGEDTLHFGMMDANEKHASNQAFDFIGDAAFSGTAGELHYAFETFSDGVADVTVVSGDTNGDGVADFEVQLWGHMTLTAGDFIL